ncbi:hypothetical protein [Sutcliffiella sp. NC1]|uniref:hypothetical protein n=1 Tax=Sutcliffiella sp. NC1 TaxID=3004096 RepID=UPI0022DDD8FC|nr:hypothetical protein [Sutcliffiella sp. NC1]WBL16377.1 hypothetical protein O1A01_07020 [Sutcliffiella sp. NC1]
MSNQEKQEILFGAGDIYIVPSQIDVDSATEEEIEASLIKIGESSGESTLNFTQNFVDVRGGALNQEIASFMTSEEATFNAGIVTFDLQKISAISSAYYSETDEKRVLGLGGQQTVPINHLRFVHTKRTDGMKLYLDMFRAQNRSGLQMTFNPESESVFNFEFKLLADPKRNNGNIVRITEEVSP